MHWEFILRQHMRYRATFACGADRIQLTIQKRGDLLRVAHRDIPRCADEGDALSVELHIAGGVEYQQCQPLFCNVHLKILCAINRHVCFLLFFVLGVDRVNTMAQRSRESYSRTRTKIYA